MYSRIAVNCMRKKNVLRTQFVTKFVFDSTSRETKAAKMAQKEPNRWNRGDRKRKLRREQKMIMRSSEPVDLHSCGQRKIYFKFLWEPLLPLFPRALCLFPTSFPLFPPPLPFPPFEWRRVETSQSISCESKAKEGVSLSPNQSHALNIYNLLIQTNCFCVFHKKKETTRPLREKSP